MISLGLRVPFKICDKGYRPTATTHISWYLGNEVLFKISAPKVIDQQLKPILIDIFFGMRVPVKISAPKVTDQLLQPILVDILEMRVPFKISVTKVTDQQLQPILVDILGMRFPLKSLWQRLPNNCYIPY